MKNYAPLLSLLLFLGLAMACNNPQKPASQQAEASVQEFDSATALLFPGEKHLKNVQQLTFGGDNAEAYWSFDSKKLVFQRTDHKTVK